MIKKNLLIFTILTVALFVVAPSVATTYAQEGQNVKLKSKQGAVTRGDAADPNIKEDLAANDKADEKDAPATRGGTNRTSLCKVVSDNYTRLNIKIFVDGKFTGMLGGYGVSETYAIPGIVVFYARADFTDGSYITWGPDQFTCKAGQTITLDLE